jgi:regulator of protease activity HflC (stomatin/prohibitin superfamily)
MPRIPKDDWNMRDARPADSFGGGLLELLKGSRLSLLVTAAILGLILFYLTCTTYVGPGEFGVKQVFYSPLGILGKVGTQEEVYGTGIHHQFPSLERVHLFPKTIQVLTMRDSPNSAEKVTEEITAKDERFTRMVKAAHIQTSDGFYVNLDTAILYRIVDPFKLINRIGAGKLYEDNGILPVAEAALKVRLGELQPEDFFDPKIRAARLLSARDLMNERLAEMGLKVDHVLARYPHLHPDVAARVEENNMQKQTKLLNISLTSQAEAEAQLKKVLNEGLAAKSVAIQKGAAFQTRRESERDLYERTRKAEGDMIRKVAEARKAELVNESYRGPGSDMLIGMKMAENLTGLDTILVPAGGENAFNPLNVESLMRLFAIGVTNQPNTK